MSIIYSFDRLGKEVLEKAETFAVKRTMTSYSHYANKRGNKSSADSLKESIYYATLCELAVADLWDLEGGEIVQEPDLEIIDKKKKSFKADLVVKSLSNKKDLKLHVKSQSKGHAGKYGTSWMFEGSDKLIWAEPLDTAQDYIVGCTHNKQDMILHCVVPAYFLKRTIKLPKLGYLRSKVALYLEDVQPQHQGENPFEVLLKL